MSLLKAIKIKYLRFMGAFFLRGWVCDDATFSQAESARPVWASAHRWCAGCVVHVKNFRRVRMMDAMVYSMIFSYGVADGNKQFWDAAAAANAHAH